MESVYYDLGDVNNHDTSAYVFYKQFFAVAKHGQSLGSTPPTVMFYQ